MNYELKKKWSYSEVIDDGHHEPVGVHKDYYIFFVKGNKRYYRVESDTNMKGENIIRYIPFKENNEWKKAIVRDIDLDKHDNRIMKKIRTQI